MLLLPLAVLAVLAIAAVLAVGRGDNLGPTLADPVRDRPPPGRLPDGEVHADEVAAVRFTTALRGYRMAEVDAVLDRLTAELEARDERIDRLENPERDDPEAG